MWAFVFVCARIVYSYVAGVCGPMVQRLGMDEIFADITELIRGRCTPGATARAAPSDGDQREAVASGGLTPRDCPNFTGHLYSPGCGGTLLEAQTGLEISLYDDGVGSGGADSNLVATASTGGSPSRLARQGQTIQAPAIGGDGLASKGQSGRGGEHEGVFTPLDSQALAEVKGGHRQRLGGCRCGCVERLATASAFAQRVRQGLLEEASLSEVVQRLGAGGGGRGKRDRKLPHMTVQETSQLCFFVPIETRKEYCSTLSERATVANALTR